jgi:thioredoxin-like negative regulator of GroEL
MIRAEKGRTIRQSDYSTYLQNGISYSQYKQQMAEDLALNSDAKIRQYININQHRMQRVEKTFDLSEGLAEQVKNLKQKIWWLILTEHWCGDAAQTLPVLNKIAELSQGRIEIKILYRDQHPELMDRFLTNGTRSIPVVIQLNENLNQTGFWGPRPIVAQQLVKQLKSAPDTAADYSNTLHLWYAKNKQQAIETEVLQLLA